MSSIERLIRNTTRKLGILLRKYQPSTSEDARLLSLLKHYKVDMVIDIGANNGQYGIKLIDGGYKGEIVSFEPIQSVHKELLRNSQRYPQWKVHPRCAIGSENTEITINISKNSVSSSVLPMLDAHKDSAPESVYIKSEKVPVQRLDDIIDMYALNSKTVLIKIDVQGFEREVLNGATELLKTAKGIQIEISLLPLYKGQTYFLPQYLDFFEKHEYLLHSINPAFTDNNTGRVLQCDAIFFKE